ncbi:hypothetical protein LINGRAHAP2_LOCUS14232 [Linum grandiflorum]
MTCCRCCSHRKTAPFASAAGWDALAPSASVCCVKRGTDILDHRLDTFPKVASKDLWFSFPKYIHYQIDLEWLNADINDLDFGENDYTCLFHLICFWDETDVRNGHEDCWVYSQWIDMMEHCIKGYTKPGGTEAVKELLLPGSIYRIQNPFLIPARRILRSCPGDFAVQIWPAKLLDRINEDLARPFLPLESFNIPTMPATRAVAQPRTSFLG